MNKKYNVEKTPFGDTIIWYEENGIRYSFTDQDPANSDYQAYLESLKDAANQASGTLS